MAEKINATCSICGNGYYMCRSCKDMMQNKPWQLHTFTSEHYKIYQTLHGYNTDVYTKEEAKSKFKTIDLSDFDNLRDNIKNIINEIINEDKNVVEESHVEYKTADLSNEIGVSNKDVDDTPNEDINNDSVIVKTRINRKRKSSELTEVVSSEIVETE